MCVHPSHVKDIFLEFLQKHPLVSLENSSLNELFSIAHDSEMLDGDFLEKLRIRIKELVEKEEDMVFLISYYQAQHIHIDLTVKRYMKERIINLMEGVSIEKIPKWFVQMLKDPRNIPTHFRGMFHRKVQSLCDDPGIDLIELTLEDVLEGTSEK